MLRSDLAYETPVSVELDSAQSNVSGGGPELLIQPERHVLERHALDLVQGSSITHAEREIRDLGFRIRHGMHQQHPVRVGADQDAMTIHLLDRAAHAVHEVMLLIFVLRDEQPLSRVDLQFRRFPGDHLEAFIVAGILLWLSGTQASGSCPEKYSFSAAALT